MLQEQVARLERIASDSVQQVVELQRQKEAAEHEALEPARQLRLFEDERAQLEAEVMQQKRAMRELQAETSVCLRAASQRFICRHFRGGYARGIRGPASRVRSKTRGTEGKERSTRT